MENDNMYFKKYLKYKNKYINLLNDYQSNKNINEQILGGSKSILTSSNTNTNIQNSSSIKKRTRSKKKQKLPPPKNRMIIALNYIFKDSNNLELLIKILTEILTENKSLINIDTIVDDDIKRKADEKKEYERLINNLKEFVKTTNLEERQKLIKLLGETLQIYNNK
jgi:hypothetical protein